MKKLSLTQAQQVIFAALSGRQATESVALADARGRYPRESLRAHLPIPAFSQSTRDGFAFRFADIKGRDFVRLPIIGESSAGRPSGARLAPRTTVRIMTGAALPAGSDTVVPFEKCQEENGEISVRVHAGMHQFQFIRRRGSDLRQGQVLVRRGQRISLDSLLLLAEAGHDTVTVGKRPRVAFLCTGSELVEDGSNIRHGQKVSGNRFLLEGMTVDAGGTPENHGPVADSSLHLRQALEQALAGRPDIIVTTGGMGPGRYDLVHEVFRAMGGHLLYDTLDVRPGRSTMFGTVDGVPLFALPGPPPVVRLLFHELVAPSLFFLQGARNCLPLVCRMPLAVDITCRGGILNLKGAVVEEGRDGRRVRPAGLLEPVTAVLLLPGHRRRFPAGATVTAHLIAR